MPTKIFITGVTGFIAGDATHNLYTHHPDLEYRFLVRTQEKGDAVKKAFPRSTIVLGGLDDSELIEEEASKADIVLHAADASDHEGAAKAIAAGILRGHSVERPGYWLHTGGAGIFTYFDSFNDFANMGKSSDRVFNDLEGVADLTNLPDEAFHRNVDKVVLEAGTKHSDIVKTAIICPPSIYGQGRGPCSVRSRQAYALAKFVLEKGEVPVLGEGKAIWNYVHVHDLSDLFQLLVVRAISGGDNKKDDTDAAANNEIWGEKGYFLAENGEHNWADLARRMGKVAHQKGFIEKEPREVTLNKDEAEEIAGFESLSWGLNSRGTARRARKLLGWKPSRPSILDEVPSILEQEKERLSKS